MIGRTITRKDRRALAADNRRAPPKLAIVPRDEWPIPVDAMQNPPARVWRSSQFLVMLYDHEDAPRLSILRTSLDGNMWADNISWDEIQQIKRQAGYGDRCAIEIFPPDRDVVNVANLRHIWLVEPPAFMWRSR